MFYNIKLSIFINIYSCNFFVHMLSISIFLNNDYSYIHVVYDKYTYECNLTSMTCILNCGLSNI